MSVLKRILTWFGSLQRKYTLGGAIALILAVVVLGVVFRGDDARAVVTALRSPSSIFASRSPGPRGDGVLYQTKPKLGALQRRPMRPIGAAPHERVLSTGRIRPAAPFAPAGDTAPLALLGAPSPLPFAPGLPASDAVPAAFEVPGFGFGDEPGFAGAPNGSGSPPPAGPGAPGTAVPEPATWLMMILGLGSIGRSLRRRQAGVLAGLRQG